MKGGLREGRPCGLWPLFLLDLYQDPRCCHLEGSCGLQKSAQDPRFCHLESSCGVQNAAPANIKYRTRQSVSDCQVKVLDICWAFGVKIHPRNYQIYTDRQTDRQTERQTNRQTDKQANIRNICLCWTNSYYRNTNLHKFFNEDSKSDARIGY